MASSNSAALISGVRKSDTSKWSIIATALRKGRIPCGSWSWAAGTRDQGSNVYVDAAQSSAAQGESGFGEGSGPVDAQRVIFGYTGRNDYVDSQGHTWRPGVEFVMRKAAATDLLPIAFYQEPRIQHVAATADPKLYRYGVYGADFTMYFTVDPHPTYYVRIKFCEAQTPKTPGEHATSIDIQGETVVEDLDIAATAGGVRKAVDVVFNGVRPQHGVIAVRSGTAASKLRWCSRSRSLPAPARPAPRRAICRPHDARRISPVGDHDPDSVASHAFDRYR